MTSAPTDIKKLEGDLWEAADNLRANSKLTSSDYFMPVLGVIFLRHAANRFDAAHRQIEADRASGKMPQRKVRPEDYIARRSLYLPEDARYDWIMQQAAVSGADLPRRDPSRVETVQFHQSYAYEDFVQGWRPIDGGGFRVQDGVFHRFCARAQKRGEPHVFIIDEINRANLSKVFGELMVLIESDKRGAEFAIPLTYSRDDGERFSVPPNVHILGLMNTADRSLAMVDYALRRRFGFVRLDPAFGAESFAEYMLTAGVEDALLDRMISRLRQLNETIREDRANLGPGFEIGHSFFVPTDGANELGESWYTGIIRSEIEPLLREYWFDNPERVKQEVDRLLT